jgi:mono/diheme cytochrome c family protein
MTIASLFIFRLQMMRKQVFVVCSVMALAMLSSFSIQKFDLKASMARGKDIYSAQCTSCHQDQGEGIEDVYPPLAKSNYLMADKNRSIRQILYGATGEMEVNGKKFNSEMSGFDLTDEQVSDLLNYIRNSWGNKGKAIIPEEVKAQRK